MKKYLRLMLLALISMVSGSAANAQDVTWQGDESSALPTEIGSDIVLTWDEGSAVQGPSFNSTKKAVSMKSGNKLTIAGADANANVTISKVDFVFDNSSDPGLSVDRTDLPPAEKGIPCLCGRRSPDRRFPVSHPVSRSEVFQNFHRPLQQDFLYTPQE